MKIKNPFVVSGAIPEQYFCDRVEESKQLVANIVNGRNTLLVSARRVGKTGLIEHCFAKPELRDDYYTFFVDILQTSSLQEFVYLLGSKIFETLRPRGRKVIDQFVQTVKSISGELGYDPLTGMPSFSISLGAIRSPEYTLDEIFKYIELADKHCVIAIDEFQQIVRYPEKNVEAILRTHIQHCSNATFLFAGSERHVLSEMFNSYSRPFYASTSTLSLEVLDRDVYREFVKYHFREFQKEIDDEVVDAVYDLFDGNTYSMQRTFNQAFEATNETNKCDFSTVNESIAAILKDLDHSFRIRLSLLTPKPKQLLLAIAFEGNAQKLTSGAFVRRHRLNSSSSVQSALKQLLSEDWVTYTIVDNVRMFRLTDEFLRLWLLCNYGEGFKLEK